MWACEKCSRENIERLKKCAHCSTKRYRTVHPDTRSCEECGSASVSTAVFHADGHPDDRGKRLCASCWVPALRRRMEYDEQQNGGKCECGKTVEEHRQEFHRLLAKIGTWENLERLSARPSWHEAMGLHRMRHKAEGWLKDNGLTREEYLAWLETQR